jgi:HEAT repeat protein
MLRRKNSAGSIIYPPHIDEVKMNILQAIRTSGKKGKELNSFTAALFEAEKPSAEDFTQAMIKGRDAERGVTIEALEYLTQTNPEAARPYLETVIQRLSDKAPRVRWEAARVITNVAGTYGMEIEPAIPGLIQNAADKGTVVRWSSAFAMGEIAKTNPKVRGELVENMKALADKEENNGVRNVYLKALRRLANNS